MPIGPTPADEPTRRLERDRPAAGNAPQGASIGASTPEKDPAGETSLLGDAENAEKTSLLDGGGDPAAGTTTLLDGGETPTTGASMRGISSANSEFDQVTASLSPWLEDD